MKAIQEKVVQYDSKQTWAKPELELVSIKERTLAAGLGADDGPGFS